MKKKKLKIREGKRFYLGRTVRLSDEVWAELNRQKKGTWNHFLSNLLKHYAKD